MEKFKIYFLFTILINFNIIAQTKTIVPKSGAIVFECKTTITDKALHDKSKKDFKKKFYESMKETIAIEQLTSGVKKVDTAKVNETVNFLDMALGHHFEDDVFKDRNGYQYHHEFQDSLITSYKTNNKIKQDAFTINSKTKAFLDKRGNGTYEYSDNNIVDIKEFKNETKMIKGYKCFKIIYNYIEPDLGGFSTLMSGYNHKRELWVTDKINARIHPIINDEEILEKYYPLEIIEYSDTFKGSVNRYELVSLVIN
jgi:hypothetical protein